MPRRIRIAALRSSSALMTSKRAHVPFACFTAALCPARLVSLCATTTNGWVTPPSPGFHALPSVSSLALPLSHSSGNGISHLASCGKAKAASPSHRRLPGRCEFPSIRAGRGVRGRPGLGKQWSVLCVAETNPARDPKHFWESTRGRRTGFSVASMHWRFKLGATATVNRVWYDGMLPGRAQNGGHGGGVSASAARPKSFAGSQDGQRAHQRPVRQASGLLPWRTSLSAFFSGSSFLQVRSAQVLALVRKAHTVRLICCAQLWCQPG